MNGALLTDEGPHFLKQIDGGSDRCNLTFEWGKKFERAKIKNYLTHTIGRSCVAFECLVKFEIRLKLEWRQLWRNVKNNDGLGKGVSAEWMERCCWPSRRDFEYTTLPSHQDALIVFCKPKHEHTCTSWERRNGFLLSGNMPSYPLYPVAYYGNAKEPQKIRWLPPFTN